MIAWLPVLAGAVAVKDVENVHLKDRTRYVTDQAGVLSATGRARADSILGDIAFLALGHRQERPRQRAADTDRHGRAQEHLPHRLRRGGGSP